MKKIAFGSDHGGIALREALIDYVEELGNKAIDLGTKTTDSVDYPDYADLVCQSVLSQETDLGILICGTGIGIGMRANRYTGIRAALVYDRFTAEMAKAHNNANILCLGGRTTDLDTARLLVKIWLTTPYEAGRHARRLEKLDKAIPSTI